MKNDNPTTRFDYQNNHFTAYDLSDIYPFSVYKTKKNQSIQQISKITQVPIATITAINHLKSEGEVPNEIIVPVDCSPNEALRQITIGDMLQFDFENAMSLMEPVTFLVQYHTLRKIVLGKLIVTSYEILFEPLNQNLKGQVDQLSKFNS